MYNRKDIIGLGLTVATVAAGVVVWNVGGGSVNVVKGDLSCGNDHSVLILSQFTLLDYRLGASVDLSLSRSCRRWDISFDGYILDNSTPPKIRPKRHSNDLSG